MSKVDRHRQLLDTAMQIVREEGADKLTLGHLATRASVSKPVVYDHFTTRSRLLIDLYRWIDTERVTAFCLAMAEGDRSVEETIVMLAETYIFCASDYTDEFHAIGAALAGSDEKAAVYQELLDNVVAMFDALLRPITGLSGAQLTRVCVGLVGAGDALSGSVVRGKCTATEAAITLAWFIRSAIRSGSTV